MQGRQRGKIVTAVAVIVPAPSSSPGSEARHDAVEEVSAECIGRHPLVLCIAAGMGQKENTNSAHLIA